jgi:integrase
VRKRINGKQETRSQRSVQLLTEARKTRNNFIHELELKEKEIKNGDLTWKAATEKYFEFRRKLVGDQVLAHKTVTNQESVVGEHTATWNDMRLSTFKKDFIEISLREKLIGYKKTSVKDILKHIRPVFEYYFNQGITPIDHNPCKGIKPWGADNRNEAIEIPKMTMEEIDKLLAHTEQTESPWYPIFYVAYYTGMRSG